MILLDRLIEIVGKEYVSNAATERFIYSRDPGLQEPHEPDYVVLPGTPEEVQKIVLLANAENIPIVPAGGSLTLSGLVIPLKGGIVMDMKRMNRIIEINEKSHYAVVEAGTTQGMLMKYLEKEHPKLMHSMPDSPPGATIVGNVVIHGSGHLSQCEGGFHSEMVTGLEVILPTGEIAKLGSCSTVPCWFSRGPLPDLAGLFLGWNATTGVVTKIGIKLYPKPRFKDCLMYMVSDCSIVPELMFRIVGTQVAEDVTSFAVPKPAMFKGIMVIVIYTVANSEKELELKKDIIIESLRDFYKTKESGFAPVPAAMKPGLLEVPQKNLSTFADVNKGGGFEYVGAIIPIEKFNEAYHAGLEISQKNGITYSLGGRVIGKGNCFMFYYAYPFNRADKTDMEKVKNALEDTNKAILKMGGIPWKAELGGQSLILKQMDHNTYGLMQRIRKVLDPKGIMNPGNWEAN